MAMYSEEISRGAENKALMRRFYGWFYNDRRYEALDDLFSPSYVHHTREVPGEKMDYEEYREHMLTIARAFPHMKAVIDDQVAEGEKVTTRFTLHGTHEGDLPGIPAKGRQVKIEVINVSRIAGGRIEEGWECYDSLDLAIQLGIAQIVTTLGKGPQEKGYFSEKDRYEI